MKKWQIAISILLVFALGTAAGAYSSRVMYQKKVKKALRTEEPPGVQFIHWMMGRLDLSEAQRASINAILDENNKKWETIQEEYAPQIKELYETVIEETKKVLTDQQRKEVEQMSAKVQGRLPRRNYSRPRSSAPPEGSTPPDSSPYSPVQPETSGPRPFGQKPDENRIAGIIEQLQIAEEKSAEVQSIIEEDLVRQQVLRENFEKSQEAEEEKFRKEMADGQLATEKKLESLLTPEQMEIYRQLMSREEPRRDDFGFNAPGGDPMEPKDFKQEAPSTPLDGDPGKSQRGTVPITWPEDAHLNRHLNS